MSDVYTALSTRLQRYARSLAKHDELASFIDCINRSGEAYVFGGAARDVSFGSRRLVHDLDIIVSGALDSVDISRYSRLVKKTNFGGLRLVVGHFDVDVWELDKSYAFRFDSPTHISVANLLKTVCFSTDGIAVSLKSGRTIRSAAFDKSFLSRRLDFVVPPAHFQSVVAARIARLALKLNLELTPSVASYYMRCVEDLGVEAIIDSEARWGNRRMLNEISIEQVMTQIRMAIDKAYEAIRSELELNAGQKIAQPPGDELETGTGSRETKSQWAGLNRS